MYNNVYADVVVVNLREPSFDKDGNAVHQLTYRNASVYYDEGGDLQVWLEDGSLQSVVPARILHTFHLGYNDDD